MRSSHSHSQWSWLLHPFLSIWPWRQLQMSLCQQPEERQNDIITLLIAFYSCYSIKVVLLCAFGVLFKICHFTCTHFSSYLCCFSPDKLWEWNRSHIRSCSREEASGVFVTAWEQSSESTLRGDTLENTCSTLPSLAECGVCVCGLWLAFTHLSVACLGKSLFCC